MIRNEKTSIWYKVLEAKYGTSLEEKKSSSSSWWRDLNSIKRFQGRGGLGWFEEHLRRVVGDGKNTSFWEDPWVDGDSLKFLFRRLFDLALDKESSVVEMFTEENGVRKIN
ncbi:unnamed protein product [Trifolium pratense]|nr:unnamed protein product [Trifolium pratense]